MKRIVVSFIIPHKGREQLLQETVRSIATQDFDLSSIEVIVVTQNDRLNEDTLSFHDLLSFSFYPRPVTDTISSLRNYGAAKAKGEYLAFLDADISIAPNWIKSMLAELARQQNRVLVGAIQSNGKHANSVEKIRTALNNINKDSNVESLHGSNLFLTAGVFAAAGGFPAELQTCEDVYFTAKVAKLGLLYLSSRTNFIHLGEDKDHWVMFKKEIWRGLSNLHSFRGRKVPLREIPSLFIPIVLMLLFISSLLLLVQGFFLPAMISTFLMLSPVIVYSLRLRRYTRDQDIRFMDLLTFYLVYFGARSIGTYKGLYSTLTRA